MCVYKVKIKGRTLNPNFKKNWVSKRNSGGENSTRGGRLKPILPHLCLDKILKLEDLKKGASASF